MVRVRFQIVTCLAAGLLIGQWLLAMHAYEHDLGAPVYDCDQCQLAPSPDNVPLPSRACSFDRAAAAPADHCLAEPFDSRAHGVRLPRAPPSSRA